MGVPGFFRKLTQKFKFIVQNKLDTNVKALYIDANCLFHPQCFKVLDECIDVHDQDKLFEHMSKKIISYIDYLIKYIKPTDLVYIAVDGVAPLAKINQQRSRRFGYVNNYKHRIFKKHNIPFNDSWSNIVITPGTDFMYRLHKKIKKYYQNKLKNNTDVTSKYTIIYSSYLTHGEGEHKILQHVKNHMSRDEQKATVIYGLDADLIFLTIASQHSNIYLLREADQFTKTDNVNDDLCFVNIDLAKKCINKLFNSFCIFGDDVTKNEHDIKFTNDYVFICYFLGNDFIPHLPSIDITMDGMDIIYNAYIDVYKIIGKNMISYSDKHIYIDQEFLFNFITRLASHEEIFFRKIQPIHLTRLRNRRCFESKQHKKEIWEIENLKNINIDDVVQLGVGKTSEWKYRYYSHYFNTDEHMQETIDKVCHNYIEGLVWITKYYFEQCPNWRWQYKYTHAPFLSDIAVYLKKIKNKNIMDFFSTAYKKPVDIYTQLLSVIPSAYSHLLPNPLRYLNSSPKSPIIDMYPLTYKIDMINKTQIYKCVPMIPYLDINRIIKTVKDIKLNDDDIIKCRQANPIQLSF